MAVKNGDAPSSPFKYILLLTGAPVIDPLEIQDLTELPNQEVHRIKRETEKEPGWMETGKDYGRRDYEAHLTEHEANGHHITAIAFLYADETFWGYAPYRPDKNGLRKDESFGWTFKLIVAETNASELTVEYMPHDYTTIVERILNEVVRRIPEERCELLIGAAIHEESCGE